MIGLTALAQRLATKKGISYLQAENMVKEGIELVKEALLDPEVKGIQIINVATLEKVERKERLGRNPKKPEEVIVIPAKQDVKFKLGKGLKEELNK